MSDVPTTSNASNSRPAVPKRERKTPARALCHDPQEELEVLIRARYPIIYVTSWEEERVELCLRNIAQNRGKKLFVWTVTQGIVKSGAQPQRAKSGSACRLPAE